jgi:hypothetical protein
MAMAEFFQPEERRLAALTNEELARIFEMRAKAVFFFLEKHVWWDSNRQVYWDKSIPLLNSLYETMLEIQSRYPGQEVREYMDLLPVPHEKA